MAEKLSIWMSMIYTLCIVIINIDLKMYISFNIIISDIMIYSAKIKQTPFIETYS